MITLFAGPKNKGIHKLLFVPAGDSLDSTARHGCVIEGPAIVYDVFSPIKDPDPTGARFKHELESSAVHYGVTEAMGDDSIPDECKDALLNAEGVPGLNEFLAKVQDAPGADEGLTPQEKGAITKRKNAIRKDLETADGWDALSEEEQAAAVDDEYATQTGD